MHTAYLIYQVERPKSAAEQRQIDRSHGELAKSLASLLRPVPWPRRSARRAGMRTVIRSS
jgi:hypothetical protein